MRSTMAFGPLAFVLGALASSSLAARQETTATCKAFKLVAELTEPSTVESSQEIFGQSVDGWLVTGVHVGAGQGASVLSDTRGTTFFANSTGATSGAGIVVAGNAFFPSALKLSLVANSTLSSLSPGVQEILTWNPASSSCSPRRVGIRL